jgi:hypothetical protein
MLVGIAGESEPPGSEEGLRLALAAAGVIAWDWDLDTDHVVCANGQALWGMDEGHAGEFLGAVHPDDRALVRATKDAAVAAPAAG